MVKYNELDWNLEGIYEYVSELRNMKNEINYHKYFKVKTKEKRFNKKQIQRKVFKQIIRICQTADFFLLKINSLTKYVL